MTGTMDHADALAREVSVVIPNYNQTRYLPGAIRSVLGQTRRPLEILVVDDGSTDDCRGVVAAFGDDVRYIFQSNQGLAGARNTGIRAARGSLIALLDADDEWQPDFLEVMTSLARDVPRAAAYYCAAQAIDVTGRRLPQVYGRPRGPADRLRWRLLRANFLICSAMILRRDAVVGAGLFDATLRSCEDWDLWLRLLRNHPFVGLDRTLALYRLHDASLSADVTSMQVWAQRVVEGQCGPDDGRPEAWPDEKRRAYGGVYRYHVLAAVTRGGEWDGVAEGIERALRCDPSLASDLEWFYDLALGRQPGGYRGSAHHLDLAQNVARLSQSLDAATKPAGGRVSGALRRTLLGTAYHAMGLVAYNAGAPAMSRRLLARALWYQPRLSVDRVVMGDLLRSAVGLGPRSGDGRASARAMPAASSEDGPTESASP